MKQIDVRLMAPEDEVFVHSSWHSTAWEAMKDRVSWATYSKEMDSAIDFVIHGDSYLIRVPAIVTVAFTPEIPDEILGYSVILNRNLYMAYVKTPYRHMGIGTGLVRGKVDTYSTWCVGKSKKFMQKMNLQYNPFA